MYSISFLYSQIVKINVLANIERYSLLIELIVGIISKNWASYSDKTQRILSILHF
jgi:hypothetical protein